LVRGARVFVDFRLGPLEFGKRRRSSAEAAAIALVSEALLELVHLPGGADDLRIVGLAQAIGALELGAYDSVQELTARSRTEGVSLPAGMDRAHTIVRALALEHLRERFLKVAARRRLADERFVRPPPTH
jgi:hypothetical protein